MNTLSYWLQRTSLARSVWRLPIPARRVLKTPLDFKGLEHLLISLDHDTRLHVIEDHGFGSPRRHHTHYDRYARFPYLDIPNTLHMARHWSPDDEQTFHATHSIYESLGFLEPSSEVLFPLLEHHYVDFSVYNPHRSTAFGKDVSHYPRGTISFSIEIPRQKIPQLEEHRQ